MNSWARKNGSFLESGHGGFCDASVVVGVVNFSDGEGFVAVGFEVLRE